MARTKVIGARIVVVRNDLPTLRPHVHDGAVRLVASHAYQIEATAKQKAPVLTGTLRRSIHTVITKGGLAAAVGPSVDYGIYPEFGTRHMAAHPYMRPAAEMVFPRFIGALAALLRGLGR